MVLSTLQIPHTYFYGSSESGLPLFFRSQFMPFRTGVLRNTNRDQEHPKRNPTEEEFVYPYKIKNQVIILIKLFH
ncbi:MAG: hypothetical protein KAW14_13395 [Candidatus Aegiribacteria sp.]|nr:hypothetical protein [Candidatus Aegiribacteria sp.]